MSNDKVQRVAEAILSAMYEDGIPIHRNDSDKASIDGLWEVRLDLVASAAISALDRVQEGWKLVPIKATQEMHEAASLHYEQSPTETWDLMIAAAPEPGDD